MTDRQTDGRTDTAWLMHSIARQKPADVLVVVYMIIHELVVTFSLSVAHSTLHDSTDQSVTNIDRDIQGVAKKFPDKIAISRKRLKVFYRIFYDH